MENYEDIKVLNEHLEDEEQLVSKRKKGGFTTIPFILANEAFERVASFGLTPNMIVYLTSSYNMSVAKAQNLLYFWNIANSFTPFVGALLADTILNRFITMGVGSIFSLLGMLVLWMTTVLPQATPPACDPSAQNCQSPTTGQYAFLVFSFLLMSIGSGGIRPCSQIFGADQVDQGDNPKNKISLETFFNWYYTFSSLSIIIALTVVVYIQEHYGWSMGFGVPVVLMFLATLSFFLATPFYAIVKANKRLLVELAQVISAAFKNRALDLSSLDSNIQYYHGKDSLVSISSDRLMFLNKACIIQNPDEDISSDGLARYPWSLSRVENVEAVKSFIRLIPIWSTGMMMTINTSATPFSILLIRTMDRHLGPNLEVPAASFGTFLIIVIVIWVPLYDRVLIPLASKIRGKPIRLSVKMRMGIGLFCAFMAMLSSGIVESVRRQRAISEGFENDPHAVIHMSAFWTLPHSLFLGLAEAFYMIAQIELFYSVIPKNMMSISGSILGLSGTFAGLLATLIMNLTDSITKRGGNDGWIASNINKGHYDYYYYLLAFLNLLNLLYYVYCSRIYEPTDEPMKKLQEEDVDEATVPLIDTGR